MGKHLPFISDKMMKDIDAIFAHGPSRAKNHDLRLGQWLVNTIRRNYQGCSDQHIVHILFNLENQELWDLIKEYNE